MPDERAFTRRQPGVNPIALELDRLAEQRALQTLGARRPPILRAEGGSTDDPRLSPADADLRTWNYAPNGGDLDTIRTALAPFQYEPGDPQWGGLEEDQAYGLWADRLAELAKRYPDMNPREREVFTQGIKAIR